MLSSVKIIKYQHSPQLEHFHPSNDTHRLSPMFYDLLTSVKFNAFQLYEVWNVFAKEWIEKQDKGDVFYKFMNELKAEHKCIAHNLALLKHMMVVPRLRMCGARTNALKAGTAVAVWNNDSGLFEKLPYCNRVIGSRLAIHKMDEQVGNSLKKYDKDHNYILTLSLALNHPQTVKKAMYILKTCRTKEEVVKAMKDDAWFSYIQDTLDDSATGFFNIASGPNHSKFFVPSNPRDFNTRFDKNVTKIVKEENDLGKETRQICHNGWVDVGRMSMLVGGGEFYSAIWGFKLGNKITGPLSAIKELLSASLLMQKVNDNLIKGKSAAKQLKGLGKSTKVNQSVKNFVKNCKDTLDAFEDQKRKLTLSDAMKEIPQETRVINLSDFVKIVAKKGGTVENMLNMILLGVHERMGTIIDDDYSNYIPLKYDEGELKVSNLFKTTTLTWLVPLYV